MRAWLALFGLLAALPAHAQDNASEAFGIDVLARGFTAVERWQIDEARDVAARALEEDPENPLTLALVGEVKLHMSDYAGAVDAFRRAREAGAPAAMIADAPLAEAAQVATGGYEEHVSEHFIVRYPPGKDALLLPYLVETLEQSRTRIGELYGWRPRSRVVVEIYPSAETLAAVSTLTKDEIRNSGTIALCRWNRLMVTSPRAVVFGYGWRDTVAHELSHLIIGGVSKNTVPIWLHEGLAKYTETAWRGPPGEALSIEQQRALVEAAKAKKLIPFEKMHPSMAKLKTQEETSLAFSEVFTFIEFLIERRGWEGMRRTLQLMSEGKSDEEAIALVHEKSLKDLSEDWVQRLRSRPIKGGRMVLAAERKLEVKSRADTPDDQLHGLNKKGRRFARAADLLYARGRLKAAAMELDKAIKETGSPLLSAKLALVSLSIGDLDTAERAARNAIAGSPDLAGPNITLAEILVRRGKTAEAEEPLAAALAVNPFDPRIHQLVLAMLGPEGDAARRAQAQRSLALISGKHRGEPARGGRGGRIVVDALPFSRVYVLRSRGEERQRWASGRVTPGAELELAPGPVELELVPPLGPAESRRVTVLEARPDGPPQRVRAEAEGS